MFIYAAQLLQVLQKAKTGLQLQIVQLTGFHVTWLQLMHVLSHISLICTDVLIASHIFGADAMVFGQAHIYITLVRPSLLAM